MKNKKIKILLFIALLIPLFTGPGISYAKTKKVLKHKIIQKVNVAKKDEVDIDISLITPDKTYKFKTKEGSNVFDAMSTLANTKYSNFTFHSKDYSSLGSFIDEINGVHGTPGHYFLYYVNGKKASVGVSKYILNSGDVIEWKQESF